MLVAKDIFNMVISDKKYLVAKNNTLATKLVIEINIVLVNIIYSDQKC